MASGNENARAPNERLLRLKEIIGPGGHHPGEQKHVLGRCEDRPVPSARSRYRPAAPLGDSQTSTPLSPV